MEAIAAGPMIELVFVLLFSVAGTVAALLAIRAKTGSRAIRWLAGAFLGVLAANLGLYLWPFIAADPAGFGWWAALLAAILLTGFAYARMLRAVRRAAEERSKR